ncbi:hypothetical protein CGRA01v4_11027 [Colletotrichum graminicola]|nr:hypothetical protein CGRA01v4_11027 [Colletotrichum graminicola]
MQNFARSRRMNCGLGLVSRQVSCRPRALTGTSRRPGRCPTPDLSSNSASVSTIVPGFGVGYGTPDSLKDINLCRRFRSWASEVIHRAIYIDMQPSLATHLMHRTYL